MVHTKTAFTLIELLVVITIITVLLSLLTPALDKAVYRAELIACSAQQDAIITGATSYAMNFKRRYPYRGACYEYDVHYGPQWLKNNCTTASGQGVTVPTDFTGGCYDDRIVMRDYVSLPQMLCPLSPKIDISYEGVHPESWLGTGYVFWLGYRYNNGIGMTRLGQRMTFNIDGDTSNTWRFNLLITDLNGANSGGTSYAAHQDNQRILNPRALQNQATVESQYDITGTDYVRTGSARADTGTPRGTLDQNSGFADGSVSLIENIGFHPIDTPTDPTALADHPLRPLPFTDRGEPTTASLSGYAHWVPMQ